MYSFRFQIVFLAAAWLGWVLPVRAQDAEPVRESTPGAAQTDAPQVKEGESDAKNNKTKHREKEEDTDENAAEPLGAWIPLKPRTEEPAGTGTEAAPKPRSEAEKAEIEEEKVLFEKLLERKKPPQETNIPPPPVTNSVLLGKIEKKRLDKAEKIQKKVLQIQRAQLKKLIVKDSRGKAELRVCTLNLNQYGTFKAVRSNTRRGAKNYLARERAITSLIAETGCDAVALQGLIGLDLIDAKKGIDRLVQKMGKRTRWRWTGYIGGTNSKLGYNGFLVNDRNIYVDSTASYAADDLVQLPTYTEDRFVRGPYEITLRVKDAKRDIWHTVVLITMCFRKAMDQIAAEPEGQRMQMAETLRRVVEQRSRQYMGESKPVVILLGDRSGPRSAPASQILEGTLQLKDFRTGGPCSVKEISSETTEAGKENKKKAAARKSASAVSYAAACSSRALHPKVLFGLSSATLEPVAVRSRMVKGQKQYELVPPDEKIKKRLTAQKQRQQSEIYLLGEDLHYAWAERNSPGRYAVSTAELTGGVKHSPLVAADLNW